MAELYSPPLKKIKLPKCELSLLTLGPA